MTFFSVNKDSYVLLLSNQILKKSSKVWSLSFMLYMIKAIAAGKIDFLK